MKHMQYIEYYLSEVVFLLRKNIISAKQPIIIVKTEKKRA